MKRMRRLALPLIVGLLLALAVAELASWATPEAMPKSVNTGQHFLPPYGNPRDRFGFGSGSLSGYDVARLHAGWYTNWGANLNPAHPDQLVYVQLLYIKPGADPHDPSQVTVRPDKATIARIAAAHPGSLWLMGNEPDSLYLGNPILPEVYAIVYHDYYEYVKGLDPTALIANGGIVQPTPCRLEYLDIVVDTYQATFSETMPVDVWNTHAFVLREVYGSWGASTPPGVNPRCAMDYTVDEAADITILWNHLKALRAWMKDHGYQDRPLIITEYGILWPQWFAPQFTPAAVSHYMTQTFDLFLNTTDLDVGYAADDYRLVQAWAWYSLSDDQMYNGYLFHSDRQVISPMGLAYGAYTAALSDTLYADLSARLLSGRPFAGESAKPGAAEALSYTVPLTAYVGNLGKLAVTDTLVRLEVASAQDGSLLSVEDQTHDVLPRFDGLVASSELTPTLSMSGVYEFRLLVDPLDEIIESREWNNVATTTLDLRPDWAFGGLDYQVVNAGAQSGTLMLTTTVRNQGYWPSPATSAVIWLEAPLKGAQNVQKSLSVPLLDPGQLITLTGGLSLSAGVYELRMTLDPENAIDETRKDNNVYSATLDLRPDLHPSSLTYQLSEFPFQSRSLAVTTTVHNRGAWTSPAASGTLYLETWPEGGRVETQTLSLPPLDPGTHITLATGVTWALPGHDIYALALVVDEDNRLEEQDEGDNRAELIVPMSLSATLMPTATTVLTSVSGAVQLIFPTGAVTAPIEVLYTPLWPADWDTDGLETSKVAFSLTAMLNGQAVPLTFAQPVSIVLRYDDADVTPQEEKDMRLFVLGDGGGWHDAACQYYQRDADRNRLTAAVCRTGRFVYWNRYDLLSVIIVDRVQSSNSHETAVQQPFMLPSDWPRSPLLLPEP